MLFLLRFAAKLDVKLAQLLFVNRRRSLREEALSALRLREGDDVADRVGFDHHGNDAVETESEAAMGRRTELEGIEEEAELLTSLFGADLKRGKDLLLNVLAVDTDRAAADFPAVQDAVIGLGVAVFRIREELVLVAVERAGERMVAGNPAVFFF